MGDSDDDFDRRRGRDKFMKERSEFQDRRRELNDGRSAASNRDYKSYRLRPEYSPNASRRRRRDWDETADSFSNNRADESSTNDGHTLAPMMTFKQFLSSQDDMISDEEAIQKYQDIKLTTKSSYCMRSSWRTKIVNGSLIPKRRAHFQFCYFATNETTAVGA
ncbi:Serrate RNA effector molecule [Trichinella spiralis]|uniref:Serrate RNA effector molecule n=1 Tax=Trichinella spiralis TaxID=6334 RepID=A0ABR3KP67_TRISP